LEVPSSRVPGSRLKTGTWLVFNLELETWNFAVDWKFQVPEFQVPG